jgi:carbon-monoxide dehydrogenase medium subunit
MTPFEFLQPSSLDEALSLVDQHGDDGKVIAGGTALVILMKQRLVRPTALISLAKLQELRGVERRNGGIRIGALTTHREAETNGLVRETLPMLAETLHHVATVRIRNVGTLGGNLAHADPNQDPPAALIALGASVEIVGKAGERTVPIEEFFTDYYETALQPGELVRAITVPAPLAGAGAAYTKFLPRTADDYATVAVAAVVQLDASGERLEQVRLGLGSLGSTPLRPLETEAALRGQPANEAAIRAASAAVKDEVDPISDIRGSAEYKRDMAEVFVRRTVLQAVEQARASR